MPSDKQKRVHKKDDVLKCKYFSKFPDFHGFRYVLDAIIIS